MKPLKEILEELGLAEHLVFLFDARAGVVVGEPLVEAAE